METCHKSVAALRDFDAAFDRFGHDLKPPFSGLCQLPLAADMASNVLEEYRPPLHHQTVEPPTGSPSAGCLIS